jgi:Flp pilus assembly protein TadD
MFMRMEDRAAAVREYREAIRVKPDHANAHYNLGIALHGSGDLDGAIVDFYETVRLKPDFEAAKQNLRIAVSETERQAASYFETMCPGGEAACSDEEMSVRFV